MTAEYDDMQILTAGKLTDVWYSWFSGYTLPGSSWTRTSTTTSVWVAWVAVGPSALHVPLLFNKQLSLVLVHWPLQRTDWDAACPLCRCSAIQSPVGDDDSERDRQLCPLKYGCHIVDFKCSSDLVPLWLWLSEEGLSDLWPLCAGSCSSFSSSWDLVMQCRNVVTENHGSSNNFSIYTY